MLLAAGIFWELSWKFGSVRVSNRSEDVVREVAKRGCAGREARK